MVVKMAPGGSPIINSRQVPLPNGPAAAAYQQRMIGVETGDYNVLNNNCFGHCVKVLRAGEVEGVPSKSINLVPWLFTAPSEQ
jgi:hypothetical protein